MRVPDKENAFTDIHVHAVPRNGKVRAHGWRRALFALAAKAEELKEVQNYL